MSEVQKDSATRESNREITQNQMLRAENQTLRDQRDRLRDELDIYRQAVQYVFEAINKFNDIQRKKAALTPAGGGKE